MRHKCARIAGVTGLVLTVLPSSRFLTAGLPETMQRGWKGVNTHSCVNE
jgi:hypothetical protein